MGRRFNSEEASNAGRVGGRRSGDARRQKAYERILGPIERDLRHALLNIRPDLTLDDVKPMRALLGRAVRAGYKCGLGTGWRRADRAAESAQKVTEQAA